MKENLLTVLAAVFIAGAILLGHDCVERSLERDQVRWSECVTVCGGSALVDSTLCLCVQSPDR